MKDYTFIVNPQAAKGRGRRLIRFLNDRIGQHKLDASIVLTEYAEHATEHARRSDAKIVVAVGGDGTVNEVANGIIGTDKVLAILPAGSGNDFVKSLAVPKEADAAFEVLLANRTKMVDCGIVTIGGRNRFFMNGVGIGFDASVANQTKQIRFLGGTLLYVVAVFQTLGKYKAPQFKVALDSVSYSSRNLLIAIGNGVCAGGGFYLTPDAKIDDGMLDACMMDDIPIRKILSIVPKVIKGKHTNSPNVRMWRGKSIEVESDEDFYIHADGEIVGAGVRHVGVSIQEAALRVVCG